MDSSMELNDEEDQLRHILERQNECHLRGNNQTLTEDDNVLCPLAWDGILCWPATPAGQLSTQPCPLYIAGFDPQGQASRLCMATGEWYTSLQSNTSWSNFTQCLRIYPYQGFENVSVIAKYLPLVKTVSQVGYIVSFVTLVVAFIILATFKRLRCPRNLLHMNLFVSFILRASLTLLKDSLFVDGVGLASDIAITNGTAVFIQHSTHNVWCKLITSLWQYFIMANYSWILMEGLYLHNLIFLALFSDTSSITTYVGLGWGLPLLFVLPWVAVRATLEDTLCWTTNENPDHFLIIKLPIACSILLNFALFVNIVRVLFLKLKAAICEETRRFRRWAKSTLVLVPLFGVHYTIFLGMSYSVQLDERIELAWLFFDQLFGSFQGCVVAILYCFLNGEVRCELKKVRKPQPLFSNRNKRPSMYSCTNSQSTLGNIFRQRRNKREKRGSRTLESCMTSLMSSVPTDLHRRSLVSPSWTNLTEVSNNGGNKLETRSTTELASQFLNSGNGIELRSISPLSH